MVEAQATLIPGLVDDLAVECLIHLPIHLHPLLRCVCRSWRSLFTSQTLTQFRQSRKLTEPYLHLMLRNSQGHYTWLFFFSDTWRAVPQMPVDAIGAACVEMASAIYIIGGSHSGVASRSVFCYLPSEGIWKKRACMHVPREFAAAGVIGNKIYVFGGCLPGWGTLVAWAEVYDPRTDCWNVVTSLPEQRWRWMHGSVVANERLFAVADSGGIVFNPTSDSWDSMSVSMDSGWRGKTTAVKGLIFSWDYLGKIKGFDFKQDRWLELDVVEENLPKWSGSPMLAGIDDMLCVIGQPLKQISSSHLAVAALDIQLKDDSLKGKLLWFHDIPCNVKISAIIHCLAVPL